MKAGDYRTLYNNLESRLGGKGTYIEYRCPECGVGMYFTQLHNGFAPKYLSCYNCWGTMTSKVISNIPKNVLLFGLYRPKYKTFIHLPKRLKNHILRGCLIIYKKVLNKI